MKRIGIRTVGGVNVAHKDRTASGRECFWINNGPVVKSMRELQDALRTMSDAGFAYHVTGAKNDFAKWVAEVIGCTVCADELAKAKTRDAALRAVAKHAAR